MNYFDPTPVTRTRRRTAVRICIGDGAGEDDIVWILEVFFCFFEQSESHGVAHNAPTGQEEWGGNRMHRRINIYKMG